MTKGAEKSTLKNLPNESTIHTQKYIPRLESHSQWGCKVSMQRYFRIGGGGLLPKSCRTLETPWTGAWQVPLSMGFPRQEYWSGLPFPSPGDLPYPGIEPMSPALQVDSLLLSCQKSPHYDIVPSRRYSRNCHCPSSLSSLPCSPLD